MKFPFCHMVFLLIPVAFIQAQEKRDTILLKEVEIRESYPSLPGIRKIQPDSSTLSEHRLNDVSEVIKTLPSLQVRSSGPGSSSLAYIRGAGASHTNITWNGIALNSPMTGQADLSLIPAFFSDDIMLLAGNNSSFSHSPAIGGTLCMDNQPVWKKPTGASADLSAGSFGNYSGGIRINTGNQRYFTRLRIFGRSDRNRFPYTNSAVIPAETMTRTGAESEQLSAQHEIYVRNEHHLFSLTTWAGSVSRNIPALMTNVGAANHDETQDDRFIRLAGAAEWNRKNVSFFIRPGMSFSELSYRLVHSTTGGSITASDSRSMERTLQSHQGIHLRWKKAVLRTGNSVTLQHAHTDDFRLMNGYSHRRPGFAHYVNAEMPLSRYFRILGAARGGVDGNEILMPAPALHLYYRPLKNNLPVFYASIGKNYRMPSLNDLYFIPGGNPSLRPEHSLSLEAGMEDCIVQLAGSCLDLTLTGFYQEITDWILWQPSQFGYWKPVNIRNATSAGFTASASWKRKWKNGSAGFSGQYTYNRANANDEAYETGQPVYLPVHNVYWQTEVTYRKWAVSTAAQFMSERKTSLYKNTWSPVLQPVWIQDVTLSRSFKAGKTTWKTGLKCSNLFNTGWQQILWRPMPGRSFAITLNAEI